MDADHNRKDTCRDCRFWKEFGMGAGSLQARGSCHYNPPAVAGGRNDPNTYWPTATQFDWCGKFDRKDAVDGQQQL